MEMKRNIQVEKKAEEGSICTALFTAVVVLLMACLKHFSSASYLIDQWRSLVFLLLNVVLLSVYFTSTRPSSYQTHDSKTRRLRMMQGKKKTMMMEEPACSGKDFFIFKKNEVIKNYVVEETKMIRPELNQPANDCLFNKMTVDIHGEEDELMPGRLSNEELNERVEAFITTFRQHLVLDARRGIDRKTYQKKKSKNSHFGFLAHQVTCSV